MSVPDTGLARQPARRHPAIDLAPAGQRGGEVRQGGAVEDRQFEGGVLEGEEAAGGILAGGDEARGDLNRLAGEGRQGEAPGLADIGGPVGAGEVDRGGVGEEVAAAGELVGEGEVVEGLDAGAEADEVAVEVGLLGTGVRPSSVGLPGLGAGDLEGEVAGAGGGAGLEDAVELAVGIAVDPVEVFGDLIGLDDLTLRGADGGGEAGIGGGGFSGSATLTLPALKGTTRSCRTPDVTSWGGAVTETKGRPAPR